MKLSTLLILEEALTKLQVSILNLQEALGFVKEDLIHTHVSKSDNEVLRELKKEAEIVDYDWEQLRPTPRPLTMEEVAILQRGGNVFSKEDIEELVKQGIPKEVFLDSSILHPEFAGMLKEPLKHHWDLLNTQWEARKQNNIEKYGGNTLKTQEDVDKLRDGDYSVLQNESLDMLNEPKRNPPTLDDDIEFPF